MADREEHVVLVTGLRGIPGIMGGVESHCEELLPRIRQLDDSIAPIVAGRRPYLPGDEETEFRGIRVVPLPAPKNVGLEAIVSTFHAVRYARRIRADMIHIHAIGPGLMAPFARMLGMKVLVTHHGFDYDRAKWGRVAKTALKLGERFALKTAHQVITVSPSIMKNLKTRFPRQAAKVQAIPNGAPQLPDTTQTAQETLAQFGLEAGDYVLTVGRLVPEKGFDYLVEAFRRSGTNRKLVIAGAADHGSAFSEELVKQADDSVRFVGAQPRSVLRHLYENASLFVLPSFHEGLPISALEAASCGTPMLLSDIDGNLDIGLPAGCYFKAGDTAALAAALAEPSDRFGYDKAEVNRRFDWDEIARSTLAVYRTVLAPAARAA